MSETFKIHTQGEEISWFEQILDYARTPLQYWFGRIPKAVMVKKTTVWTLVDGVQGMLPAWPDLHKTLINLGLSPERPTLVYDQNNGLYAARLGWALLNAGFTDVSLLEGGWEGWKASRPTTRVNPRQTTELPSDAPSPQRPWYATLKDVAQIETGTVLLDTRSRGEFLGTVRRSARAGRIPGSVHWEWKKALDATGLKFKSAEKLKVEFAALGITPDTKVITYCQSGVRASHTAYALAKAGIPQVRVYDGSWEEWGNRTDTPLTSGEER